MGSSGNTKELLSQSLFSLLDKHPLNKITVGDIVDNSDMCRQTFYLHFKDKYDLAYWTYKQRNDSIVNQNAGETFWKEVLCKLLEDHKENRRFIHSLRDYGNKDPLHEFLTDYTFQTYYDIANRFNPEVFNNKHLAFSLQLYCCGSADMTYTWVKKGMTVPPAEVAEGLFYSMPKVLLDAFHFQ